jgi:mycothiol synthase
VSSGSQDLVRVGRHLSADVRNAVEELVDAAAQVDGVRALDERATLLLRNGGGDALHLLTGAPAAAPPDVTGYARLDRPAAAETGADTGPVDGDVVVHPEHRGRGLGRALVDRVLREAAGRPVQIWAHGPHPAAARLAEASGFTVVRQLLWMRRAPSGPGAAPLPDVPTPDGVTIRAFRPGRDDAAWLAVNAEAFASHPEQGRWTQADLDARIAAPWFDAAGFFLAERGGSLLGFHWTKVHLGEIRGDEPGPVGEIYVLGVRPEAQGTGLARALAATGLRHLQDRGVRSVMLYVEADNTAAVRLYERFGFTTAAADVMYRHPGD